MHQVLVAARRSFTVAFGIFSCGMWTLSCIMWGLVPWPRTEPGPLALGAWSLSHWTTREVPEPRLLFYCGESKHLSLSLLESCCVDISFHFSQCLSRSGMTGSYGTFWRNYQIVFPCSCAISRFPAAMGEGWNFFPFSPAHVIFCFWMKAILVGMNVCLFCVRLF